MSPRFKRILSIIATIILAIIALAGCSNKQQQVYNDSARTAVNNTAPADIIAMPDGFSNLATKCINGERFTVAFHNDSAYAAISVVPSDPTCK